MFISNQLFKLFKYTLLKGENIKMKKFFFCLLTFGFLLGNAEAVELNWGPPPFGAALANPLYNSCAPLGCNYLDFTDTTQLSLGATIGKGYGLDQGHGTFGTFISIPTCGDAVLPFIDVRGHLMKNHLWAVNSGVGIRLFDSRTGGIFGANLYYDYRQTDIHQDFNQIGFGVEFLGQIFDYRLNAYFPIGHVKAHSNSKIYDDYIGNYLVSARKAIYALKGFDTEVSWHMFEHCGFNFYSALGTYYFTQLSKHTWGVQARLGFNWYEFVSVELKTTYDRMFQTKIQGIFGIILPFDLLTNFCCNRKKCAVFLSQPVMRKDLIVLKDECCYEWNYCDER